MGAYASVVPGRGGRLGYNNVRIGTKRGGGVVSWRSSPLKFPGVLRLLMSKPLKFLGVRRHLMSKPLKFPGVLRPLSFLAFFAT